MKNLNHILTLTLLSLILIGCNTERTRQDKVSAMINSINSPFFITTLTPQSLIEKSGIEDGVLSYTEQTLVSFFISSENTGVDNTAQVQIIAGKGSGMTPDVYSIFKLNNADKFETLIKKELGAEVKEKEGYNYFVYDNYYVIAWQGEFAVGCNTTIDFASMFGGKGSSNSKTVNKCISLIKAGSDGDVSSDFSSFLSKTNDISTYFDAKNVFSYLKTMKVLNTKDIKKYETKYGNTIHESALNFEKGKITFDQDFILTDILKEQFGFLENEGIDSDLFAYGKSNNPMVKYSFNLNPKKALEFMKNEMNERDFKKMTQELSKVGFTADDFANSFSGQGLIMIDGFNTTTELVDFGYGNPFETKSNEPILGAVFGLNDNSIFDKLPKEVTVSQNGFMTFEDNLFGCVTNEVFFVSTDSSWVNTVMNGTATKIKSEDVLTENPYGFFALIDAEKNKQLLEGDLKIAALFTKAFGFFDLENSKFTLELKNTSDNALKVITKYLSDLEHNYDTSNNIDMSELLDEEVLEDVEEAMDEVEKALENIDVDAVMNDILKEVGK